MFASNQHASFELLLFAIDTQIVEQATAAGVHGFIVDMEVQGKKARQVNYDTQVNENTFDDLVRVRTSTNRRVLCRINGWGSNTAGEVEQAISGGADEIFLPMVRQPEEVERVLDLIRGRCDLAILIETKDAVQNAPILAQFPLSRVYVGLNDLAIDQGFNNIFSSVVDGTVECVRQYFHVPFGFGGLTLPECGSPIPCRLLMGEMARLDCQFSFLRRSFYRDTAGKDYSVEIPRILQSIAASRQRRPEDVQREKDEFANAVDGWREGSFLGQKK